MTDVELDARVAALEESGGGGDDSGQNGKLILGLVHTRRRRGRLKNRLHGNQ